MSARRWLGGRTGFWTAAAGLSVRYLSSTAQRKNARRDATQFSSALAPPWPLRLRTALARADCARARSLLVVTSVMRSSPCSRTRRFQYVEYVRRVPGVAAASTVAWYSRTVGTVEAAAGWSPRPAASALMTPAAVGSASSAAKSSGVRASGAGIENHQGVEEGSAGESEDAVGGGGRQQQHFARGPAAEVAQGVRNADPALRVEDDRAVGCGADEQAGAVLDDLDRLLGLPAEEGDKSRLADPAWSSSRAVRWTNRAGWTGASAGSGRTVAAASGTATVGAVVGGMSAATSRSVCLARIRPVGVGTSRQVPEEIASAVAFA
ncbi:hypothetical protein [Goekera deserti]|uniref:Uncharacterized protein n=1 Tax=Goekera deserti TaxID=2497753 RepID=A0A7K3WDU5_9ACTN|nr:hypothetical protein [Goekera deserti]NEL54655.1 hypothetical protein [Goekera deserti]